MTDVNVISKSFGEIGARAKVAIVEKPDRSHRSVVVDVRKDKKGEYFDIRILDIIELFVLDQQPADRHLLLMARGDKGGRWFKYNLTPT